MHMPLKGRGEVFKVDTVFSYHLKNKKIGFKWCEIEIAKKKVAKICTRRKNPQLYSMNSNQTGKYKDLI